MKYFSLIITAFCAIYFSNQAMAQVFELARAPQSSAKKLTKDWKPFLKKLNTDTGIKIKLKLFKNRKDFEKYLSTDNYDFLFANPYYSLLVRDKHGYEAIIRSGKKQLKGIVVVAADSNITIESLAGQSVAFPGINALAASMLVRSSFAQKNIKVLPVYTKTHENTYLSVVNKMTVAGGGIYRTFDEFNTNGALKVIYETPAVATHPLSIHPRVAEKVKHTLVTFILALDQTGQGKKILKNIKLAKPVEADFKRDYEILRTLNVSEFSNVNL